MYKSLYLVCTCIILFKLHNKPMKTRRGMSNLDELVGFSMNNYFNRSREESLKDD